MCNGGYTYSDDKPAVGFGWALSQLQIGNKVTRKGWNGKGMFLVLIPADKWGFVEDFDVAGADFGTSLSPFIAMKTADNKAVPWLASQTDLLAEDWDSAD